MGLNSNQIKRIAGMLNKKATSKRAKPIKNRNLRTREAQGVGPEGSRVEALANFLGISSDEIETSSWDDKVFSTPEGEYMVLTDEEAQQQAMEDICESLWAFNPEFITRYMGLPPEAEEMIRGFAEAKLEDANDTFAAMLGDNLGELVDDAIAADGRGHFINTYDGGEEEVDGFFIYRTN